MNELMHEDTLRASRIEMDQAHTIHQNFLISLFGVAVAAALILSIYVDKAPLALLLPWCGWSLLTIVPRYWMIYRKSAHDGINRNPAAFLKINAAFALMTSISFSVWSFYNLHTQNFSADATLLFICMAYCAASVITSSAYPPIALSVVIPICLTFGLTTLLADQPGMVQQLLALLTIFAVFLRVIKTANGMFHESKAIKYDHEKLIEELKRANEQEEAARRRFEFLAHHDPLTGLNNRISFNQELKQAMEPEQLASRPLALILLDVDHFKTVNDTLGHAAGDALLEEAAMRFVDCAPPDSVVARLGGDEFAILCHGEEARRAAERTARQILAANRLPMTFKGRALHLSTSIGIACAPADAATPNELISHADLALYAAKDGGRQRAVTFHSDLHTATQARRQLELDFPGALNNGDLELFFQPQLRLEDCKVVGFEGLLRWRHPVQGAVPPPDIVEAAQALNMSAALNRFILDECVRLLRDFRLAGFSGIRVAANISPRDIIRQPVADTIAELLERHDVEAGLLEIEITEETMLDLDAAHEPLSALSQLGVRLAVDDFGVGYSSLAYLHQLKVDAIKIDRRFTTGIATSESNRAIVNAMLGVGKSLNVDVVAEGVETAEEMAVLVDLGCEYGQGYYFCRPMPRREVLEWLGAVSPGGYIASPAGGAFLGA